MTDGEVVGCWWSDLDWSPAEPLDDVKLESCAVGGSGGESASAPNAPVSVVVECSAWVECGTAMPVCLLRVVPLSGRMGVSVCE